MTLDVRARSEWLRPGAFDVAPGIFRIPLPLPLDGLHAVNVYAIVGADEVVLVDGGWAVAESRTQLLESLRRLGIQRSDITRFLVTHVHRDHYTQAVTMRRETGAAVALGSGERESLAALIEDEGGPGDQAQLAQLRRYGAGHLVDDLLAHGWGDPPDRAGWELPDRWLADGDLLTVPGRTLLAVHTPGHTRGHMVFADQQGGLLFAGDHVLPHITPSIGFESRPAPAPLADYLRSLAKVRRMPDARLLPAHGPVTESTHERVDELLAHHEARLEAAQAAVEAGAATPYDVAQRLRWTRREHRLVDLDPMNQMLAICETAAHLDVLVAQHRLRGPGSEETYSEV
jgi:glyoxylase-like metal-dependent hydrolase (beta-lactamase superfamily II)